MNIISVQSITDRQIIDAIAPNDFMLIGDASDNNVVKRVLVSSLKSFFTASSPTPTPTPTPTSTLWTPASLSLDLWLDAADVSSVITISGGVSQWSDKSGNARHAIQPIAGNRPLYSIATRNGLNVLLFDNASSFLQGALSPTGSANYTGNFTLFWVGTRNTTSGGGVFVDRLSTTVKSLQWAAIGGINYISSDGSNPESNHTIGSNTYDLVGSNGAIVSHTHKFGFRDILSVNGTVQPILEGVGTAISGANGYLIGVRENKASGWWSGEMWEQIAVAGVLTPIEEEKLTGYWAHKWGLTASLSNSHPYKSSLPYI